MKDQWHFDCDFLRSLSNWIVGRQYDAPWDRQPQKWYRRWRAHLLFLPISYLILPLVIFDITETAVQFDGQEYYHGRLVAIGPRPRYWVPNAMHGFDIPGGPDYTKDSWPFVVWKPICILYCIAKGFAMPGDVTHP